MENTTTKKKSIRTALFLATLCFLLAASLSASGCASHVNDLKKSPCACGDSGVNRG